MNAKTVTQHQQKQPGGLYVLFFIELWERFGFYVVNGLLVYLFAVLLLNRTRYRERRQLLAAAVALAWLISAVNVSGVLYAVQRMNQLSAFFSLGALVYYLRIRGAGSGRPPSAPRLLALIAGVAAFTVVAYLCKENALLVPLSLIHISEPTRPY